MLVNNDFQWNFESDSKKVNLLPDDVLDGNAIRLAPFRRDRLT